MERLDDDKKKEKRREHNRKKMYEFFLEKDRSGRPRHKVLEELKPDEVLRLLKWFQILEPSMDALKKYAGLHKQAVRELDETDVRAVQDLLLTRSVLES